MNQLDSHNVVPVTLENALARGRRNNFDLVRLALAVAVVISHAWPLALGPGAREPLEGIFPVSLGGSAVLLFFFISGLLVTASAHRPDQGLADFAIARAARIVPGLAVALGLTAIAFAGFADAAYSLTVAEDYILRGLALVSPLHEVPGLFTENPYPLAPNGPLWTLFYEVACYGLLALAVRFGLLATTTGWILSGLGIALLCACSQTTSMPDGPIGYRLATGAPLGLAFYAGALCWRLRATLLVDWRLGALLWIGSIAAGPSETVLPLYTIALGYLALLLAYRTPTIALGGDISYGVYIYGWPLAQMTVALVGEIDPIVLATLSTLAVLPVAVASWFLVERPALSLASRPARPAIG
ncbi:MAG: acyltransferase [Pseudomonadota bacterium]